MNFPFICSMQNKRLTEDDFSFAKDGSTGQKLDILERMMLIKKNVTMIGDFTDGRRGLCSSGIYQKRRTYV